MESISRIPREIISSIVERRVDKYEAMNGVLGRGWASNGGLGRIGASDGGLGRIGARNGVLGEVGLVMGVWWWREIGVGMAVELGGRRSGGVEI